MIDQGVFHNDVIAVGHRYNDSELFEATVRSYTELAKAVRLADAGHLATVLRDGKRVIFEAAQGTLLDEDYGFFPYVTRSKVRDVHAHELLADAGYAETPYVLGITRAYAARHGPGPFPTEEQKLSARINEAHNANGRWQGAFRMGHFDAVATRYAITANKQVDGIAITCVDQLTSTSTAFTWAKAYRPCSDTASIQDMPATKPGDLTAMARRSTWLLEAVAQPLYQSVPAIESAICDVISSELDRPVAAISAGVTREDKSFFPATRRRVA